ncbi:MAG TPA: sigma factor-like helix-turn-helix DNA-binding protein [Armatimonadota bacterium]|nr:sigma factor-like helix-turn-helix DNA-binding protein [Armatimonadota bacterium]
MGERDRLVGRNGKIWRLYCRGWTQERIAQEFEISQQRVSQIIRQVRDSLPQQTREEVAAEILDFLREARTIAMDLVEMNGAPVTAGKDGEVVRDPETGEVVRDFSGRLRALETAGKFAEWERRMLGIDAPSRLDVNVGEQAAAERAAAEALSYLHGEDD